MTTKNHDIKLGVSLYSYQDNYYFHKHDLEGCIAAAAGSGATGIEAFAEMMMPEWPYISDRFVDLWNGRMRRYGVEPVAFDHFSDRGMWKNKELSDEELVERGKLYIRMAKKLGFPVVRVLHHEHIGRGISPYRLTDVKIVEQLLPLCAELDIMLALECHAPTTLHDPVHQQYLDMAERMGMPYVGLMPDFSMYEYCVSTADVGLAVREGATREILEFYRNSLREAYFRGEPFIYEEIAEHVEKMNPSDLDRNFIGRQNHMVGTGPESLEILEQYASKLVYCHGKFYDLDQDGQVDNIDYPKVIQALKKGGYKGYISSEFEGNRRMNDAGWVDEIEYVRRHQELMRKCLAD